MDKNLLSLQFMNELQSGQLVVLFQLQIDIDLGALSLYFNNHLDGSIKNRPQHAVRMLVAH